MQSFNHINVKTVGEAVKLLNCYKGKSKLIAGGTDLLGVLKDRIHPDYPEVIINIKTIPDLDYIKEDVRGLKIGGLTTLSNIAKSPVIKARYKVLAEAALSVATPQIRNMATLAGNLCQDVRCWYYRYPHQIGGRILCWRKGNGSCLAVSGDNRYHAILKGKRCFAVCPADTAVALNVLNAKINITGMGRNRIVSIKNFFNPQGNILQPGEIITEIQLPKPPNRAKQTFLKFALRKPIDFAIVSVATVIVLEDGICKDARIALGGVAPTPVRATKAEEAIKGKIIDLNTAAEASEAATIGAKPLSKNAYKIEETKILVQRAILT